MSRMWRRFQDLVGVDYPVMQDGMGPSPTTHLAAAVSAAGGLGTVSCPSITNTSEEFLRKGFRSAIEYVTGMDRLRLDREERGPSGMGLPPAPAEPSPSDGYGAEPH